ncbi:MAG: glycoside hydrolase family 3 protein [Acidothermus cellulolyticus]|nr:glycoside hydrolase family 3 protein [Acidothermus cellulolyticus]MCL6549594.1 glycoside hydrolase family 3 protein [Acidothermus cellulolyticus]
MDVVQLVNSCLLPGFAGGDQLPDWVRRALDQGLAGVAIYGHNLVDDGSVARIAQAVHNTAPDALVALDEEGGDVTRLEYRTGSSYPGNLALGVVDDLELTARVAAAIAADLVAAGVNYNLAPAVDVNSDPRNPVIGVRSFGADPDKVAAHGATFITAMQSRGIATAAKHFPGHGATVADSHHTLPVIDVDEPTFRRRDLPPFVAAIQAGAASIMTSHVVFTALDADLPATLSPRLLRGLLRSELGYSGVVVTDALDMRAVADTWGIAGAAVRALAAGADLLLVGAVDGERYCAEIHAAVTDAIAAGDLTVETLEAAAARIRALREFAAVRRGDSRRADGRGGRDSGLLAARRALQVRGDVHIAEPAVVVELRAAANPAVGEAYWSLADALDRFGLLAERIAVHDGSPHADEIAARAQGRPVVVAVRDAYRSAWQRDWVRAFFGGRPDAVLVAVGMPNDAELSNGRVLLTFGAGLVNMTAAAEVIAGRR